VRLFGHDFPFAWTMASVYLSEILRVALYIVKYRCLIVFIHSRHAQLHILRIRMHECGLVLLSLWL
jgi:hypothetical protein